MVITSSGIPLSRIFVSKVICFTIFLFFCSVANKGAVWYGKYRHGRVGWWADITKLEEG